MFPHRYYIAIQVIKVNQKRISVGSLHLQTVPLYYTSRYVPLSLRPIQNIPVVNPDKRFIADFVCCLICGVSDKSHIVDCHIIVDGKNAVCFSLRRLYTVTEQEAFILRILQKPSADVLVRKINIDPADVRG